MSCCAVQTQKHTLSLCCGTLLCFWRKAANTRSQPDTACGHAKHHHTGATEGHTALTTTPTTGLGILPPCPCSPSPRPHVSPPCRNMEKKLSGSLLPSSATSHPGPPLPRPVRTSTGVAVGPRLPARPTGSGWEWGGAAVCPRVLPVFSALQDTQGSEAPHQERVWRGAEVPVHSL